MVGGSVGVAGSGGWRECQGRRNGYGRKLVKPLSLLISVIILTGEKGVSGAHTAAFFAISDVSATNSEINVSDGALGGH